MLSVISVILAVLFVGFLIYVITKHFDKATLSGIIDSISYHPADDKTVDQMSVSKEDLLKKAKEAATKKKELLDKINKSLKATAKTSYKSKK